MFRATGIFPGDFRNRWCVLDLAAFILDTRANEVMSDVYMLDSTAISLSACGCEGFSDILHFH